MKNYQEITTPSGATVIQLEENGLLLSIPSNPANSDYQAYLRWLENPNAEENGGLN